MKTDDCYSLNGRDRSLIAVAESMLVKIAAARATTTAQRVTVWKLIHVIATLPVVSLNVQASASVRSPMRSFGEIGTFHYWECELDEGEFRITRGAYRSGLLGGDGFTSLSWIAVPGDMLSLKTIRQH